MSNWKSDFEFEFNLHESKQKGLTKPLSKKDEMLHFYTLGRRTEREKFREIFSNMRSSLSSILIHFKNIFVKYKIAKQAAPNQVDANMVTKEEKTMTDLIQKIEEQNEDCLQTFLSGEDKNE